MEKKNEFLIYDTSIGKNSRSYEQRRNDMNALSYLTVIHTDNGSPTESGLVAVRNFFDDKKYLSAWTDGGISTSMRRNLTTIQRNWKKYKNSDIINYIASYVADKMSTISPNPNDSNMWITFKSYYIKDDNRNYFAFEKLFAKLADGTLDEENARREFDEFITTIEKESGLRRETESV